MLLSQRYEKKILLFFHNLIFSNRCDLNTQCLPLAHMFEHLVPNCSEHCVGRFWNFQEKSFIRGSGSQCVCGQGWEGGWDCTLMFYSPAPLPVLTSCEEVVAGF